MRLYNVVFLTKKNANSNSSSHFLFIDLLDCFKISRRDLFGNRSALHNSNLRLLQLHSTAPSFRHN